MRKIIIAFIPSFQSPFKTNVTGKSIPPSFLLNSSVLQDGDGKDEGLASATGKQKA